jgi:hypothetical protein
MASDLFLGWLEAQRALQVKSYGVDPVELEGKEYADYVMFNGFAAQCELAEAFQLIPWKPWIQRRGLPTDENRTKLVEEMADVLMFIGNILIANGVDDAEINAAYREKLTVNAERMRSKKYQGRAPVKEGTSA